MARTTIPAELVAVNAIQGTLIADNAITAVHIATNAVSGTLVADNAITSTHIAQNNVTATQIAQNTITVTQMADSAIETAKINNDAVTQAKIADDAVGPDQLAANAVVSASIANGTIVEADMADNAVTLAKMASLARGSIIYGDSAGDPAALSIGSNGTVLKSDGTDVSWGTVSAGVAGISTSADATAITIDSSERVMIGSTTSAISANAQKLQIANAGATSVYHSSVMLHSEQNDGNANVNRISWSGGDGASANRVFSSIEGGKENSTSGEYGGMISMSTRPHGGTQTERMRIDSSGNVGIGTSSPSNKLDVSGTGSTKLKITNTDTDWAALDIQAGGNQANYMFFRDENAERARIQVIDTNHMIFSNGSSPTERMRIDSSGSLGLGTNNPGSLLHVAHSNGGANPTARIENTTGTVATNSVLLDLKFSGDDSFSNCDYLRFQDSSGEEGVITGDGGGRVYYEINSDYRLKENVLNYSGGLNKIKALSVKRYNYKTRPGTTYTGFLAHEVAEVVDGVARGAKDAVNPDGTPDYQGMDLSKLVPELVSAIQEQQTIIDDLKSRIETLEG